MYAELLRKLLKKDVLTQSRPTLL